MLLTLYILIPAVAALAAWLLGRSNPLLARWTAVLGTAVPLVLLIAQWIANAGELRHGHFISGPDSAAAAQAAASAAWIAHVKVDWIPSLGISYFLAADGLTLIMLLLTFGLGLLAVLCSWRGITDRSACST